MKKIILVITCFLIPLGTSFAADTEVQDLTDLAAPDSADVMYIVDDPSGTPASRKTTLANLAKGIDLDNAATGTLGVARGGTDAATFTDGGVLLGNGTSAIQAMAVLTDGSIIVGDGTTDPATLAAFTASTGTLKHESGGLEADVSGYGAGIYGQNASNATIDIDTEAELETAIGSVDLVSVTAGDVTSANMITAVSDETGTGALVFANTPTLVTPVLGAATGTSLDLSGTIETGSGNHQLTNAAGLIDGEKIQDDTIDDDSIDFSVGAGVGASDMPDQDVGDMSISSGVWSLDQIVTTSDITAATLVTEAEGISSNDNDTTLPTSAAVKDYADTNDTDTNAIKLYSWAAPSTIPTYPVLTGGDAVAPISLDTDTNLRINVASFNDTADECRGVQFKVPEDVDTSGTAQFHITWYAATAASANVVWDFRWLAINEGDNWDNTLTVESSAADAADTVQDEVTETTWTETMGTLGWTADETVEGYFCRDGDAGTDTLSGDAQAIMFAVEVPRA